MNKQKSCLDFFYVIFNNLFCVLLMFVFSFSFSQTTFVQKDVLLKELTRYSSSSETGYFLGEIKSNSSLPYDKMTQLSGFEENLRISCPGASSFLFSADEEGIPLSFSTHSSVSPDNFDFSLVTFPVFSNSTKFECIDISLFYDGSKERQLVQGYSGDYLAYIPDYYADKLIELSSGKFISYESLLKGSPCLYCRNPLDSSMATYRICNIYRCNGFDPHFGGSSSNLSLDPVGQRITSMFSPFVVVIDKTNFYKNKTACCLGFFGGSTQSSIAQIFEHTLSLEKKGNVFASIFSINSKNTFEETFSTINDFFYSGSHDFSLINGFFFASFLALFPFYIVFYVNKWRNSFASNVYLLDFVLPFTIESIFEIIRVHLFSFCFLSFINQFFGVCFLILLAFSCLFIIKNLKLKKERECSGK